MEKRTRNLVIALCVAMVLLAAGLSAIYIRFSVQPDAGNKKVQIEVKHGDGSSRIYDLRTDEEYLAQLLIAEKIAEGSDGSYGLFITSVDGEIADGSRQEWWCITENGEMVMTSASETPLKDGSKFELTLTVGYDQ